MKLSLFQKAICMLQAIVAVVRYGPDGALVRAKAYRETEQAKLDAIIKSRG